MAAFTCDGDAAQALLPGEELHAVRLPNGRGLFVVTVIDYRTTDIGALRRVQHRAGLHDGRHGGAACSARWCG